MVSFIGAMGFGLAVLWLLCKHKFEQDLSADLKAWMLEVANAIPNCQSEDDEDPGYPGFPKFSQGNDKFRNFSNAYNSETDDSPTGPF